MTHQEIHDMRWYYIWVLRRMDFISDQHWYDNQNDFNMWRHKPDPLALKTNLITDVRETTLEIET